MLKKITFLLLIFVLLAITPGVVLAAACPATDGGVGDDDGSANGVITINTDRTWTATAENEGFFDCSHTMLRIRENAVLTLEPYDNEDEDYSNDYPVQINLIDLAIDAGSTISSNALGYRGGQSLSADGYGPAGGDGAYDSGGGGGHAGRGGKSENGGTISDYYGRNIFTTPQMGSGSGASGSCLGESGGGAIKIVASRNILLNGEILADGEAGCGSGNSSGGGAGGAIYISTRNFYGSGSLSANGGSTNQTWRDGGGGGGGRILVNYSGTNTFSGAATASGGTAPSSSYNGTDGSVIFYDTLNSDLYLKSSMIWDADPTMDGSSHTFRNFYIQNNSAVKIQGYYTDATDGVGIEFNTENFTIDTGSSLSADGGGYDTTVWRASGYGPGGGSYHYDSGGGGGYGGSGGRGENGGSGGTTYGDTSLTTVHLGSSGGASGSYSGGAGGGAISIFATDTLTINGNISANGTRTTITNNGQAGAGSGGSIYLKAPTIVGSADVTANGGASTAAFRDGGAGGGGRIVVTTFDDSAFTGSFSAAKGTAASSSFQGNDGTVSNFYLPGTPTDLTQYKTDGVTIVAEGANHNETSIKLEMQMSHADSSENLTPEFELRELGTDFTDTATTTGDSVSYSGSAVTGTVTVADLVEFEEYHWQGRVCDSNSVCSAWISYGSNAESAADFSIFLNSVPDLASVASHNQYLNTSQPNLSFTLSDTDEAEQLRYQIQIDDDSAFSSPLIDYLSAFGDEGAKTYSIGQAAADGAYTVGNAGQTLSNGNYYYRIRVEDDSNEMSDWVTGENDPDLVIDLDAPSNATALKMRQAAGETQFSIGETVYTNNPAPYFSWSEAVELETDLKGYCLYLGTDADADPRSSKGVLGTSPVSTTATGCQFIVASNEIDFATLSYRGETWLDDSNGTYYLIVRAIDLANNVFAGLNDSNIFEFSFDDVAPSNVSSISGAGGIFSNIADMYFNWPTSGNSFASDGMGAGLLGFQYSINGLDNWHGVATDSNTGLSYVPFNYEQPLYLSSADEARVGIGDNTIYFRTVDLAGNFSSSSTYRTASIAYGGDAPSFTVDSNLTVTPSSNTENSYAFSWDSAVPASNRTIATYYYMINTRPPATLSTLESNSSTYVPITGTEVAAKSLTGVHKGSNEIYVVAVDDLDNYSPSNYLMATFTLDSALPDSPKNLVVSDSSIKSASIWRASLAWDQPDYTGTGNLTYRIERSVDAENWTLVATTSGLAYVDTVSESKNYYWRVATADSSDESIAMPSYSNAIALLPKGSYDSAPTLSSGPSASNITTKRAKIAWTTNRAADSKVYYGTSSDDYADEGVAKSEQVSDHEINLLNLEAGTKYYYKVEWTDEDGNLGTSDEEEFTTDPAPTVKDVEITDLGLSRAILDFTVKDASKVKIYYGTSTDFGGAKEISTSVLESGYTVELSDLADGTKYYYKINTFDSEDEEYEGTILDFETLPRPRVSDIKIQQVKNSASPAIMLTWQSNTEISSIVTYYPSNNTQYARDQIELDLVEGEHQLLIRGLAAQTEYHLVVKGRDRIGNEASSDLQVFTTATDTRPPMISNLYIEGTTVPTVSGAGQEAVAQLIISWDTDEPASSQVEFAEGTGTSFTQKSQEDSNLTYNHLVVISGLNPSKVYHLRAISKDPVGNIAHSVDTTTITPRATDNALNLVINNLQEAFSFLGGF